MRMAAQIEAIVFDFDGMVYLTDERFSERFSRDFNVPIEEVAELFKNEFQDCQRGKLDLKSVLQQKYLSRWNWNKGIDPLFDYWFSDGKLNEDIVGLIRELRRKGIKCVLCTNNDKYRIEYLKDNIHLDDLFDDIVASYEVSALKTEDRMLQAVTERCGSKPGKILFCDDKESHVQILEKQGFLLHIYKGLAQFKTVLSEYGIEVDK